MTLNLKYSTIGGGYGEFIGCEKRYRVVKGSRGSKKSCTAALWYILKMIEYSQWKPNLLVVRRYFNTHWNSTRAQLIWAIQKLGVESLFRIPKGSYDLTYLPTGQKILFRGMDDPQSITSIAVSEGHLCWVWFEEAYQIQSEEDFNKIDMSIRGELPRPLFKQITVLLNPWSDRHWIKRRFFDSPDSNTLAMTTNYMCNEFLGADDIAIFEQMKEKNPKRYRIEGLGEWGISEGLIYENWEVRDFDVDEIIRKNAGKKDARGAFRLKDCVGCDFGFVDPTVVIAGLVDTVAMEMYVYYEYYESGASNQRIASRLITDGFGRRRIVADCAEPRTISELKKLGVYGIEPCNKNSASVVSGIRAIQGFKIYIHPKCVEFQKEISNYCWQKDRLSGSSTEKPEHEFSHGMDAWRYACQDVIVRSGVRV
ncbi:MAG: PBSX family phage terminase large subunit [Lachnospiraceae bacterium]|nr:PBSX family phage terminase large subunit [Lachnospiraceae bacterium]